MTTIGSTSIVNLQAITKTYRNQVTALNAVDLTIARQEIVGIMGANGSGKSTLLKIIAGTLTPELGSAKIFEQNIAKNNEQLTHKISYISQDKALDPEMTGKELLGYFAALYGLSSNKARQRTTDLITTFKMDTFICRRVNTYSGGQAQRLHLAIGIIHQPELLLLDEPTSAIDPGGKAFLWDFIQAYQQQGNTIIIISHELETIYQYCSRVLLLDNGQVIAYDTPNNIVHTYAKPVLLIKVAEKLKNTDALKPALQQTISSENIQFQGQSVRLEIDKIDSVDKSSILQQVLQAFASQQLAVTECRWEEPGLANAYFKLTDKNIIAPSITKKGKRKRA